jgi:hypothetical protein
MLDKLPSPTAPTSCFHALACCCSGLIFVAYCVVCYLVTALLFSLLILDLAALVITASFCLLLAAICRVDLCGVLL